MGDPLPPDPYLALGVAKDATAAAIKTQYRKLVLKFHPDKVSDESQKQAAADQFHKIQTAYEIVSDESRRARYDAQCKLAELRKDVMSRDGGGGGGNGRRRSSDDERSPRYASQPEYGREYPAREPRSARASPPQYQTEERRPDHQSRDYFDAEPPKATSRKDASSDYERGSKRASPKDSKTKSSKSSSIFGGKKKTEKSTRKEKDRKADRDVKQGRQQKYTPTVEEDSESDQDSYTKRFRQEDMEKVRNDYWEHTRRQREQAEQGYFGDERTRKLFTQGSEARDYIGRSGRTPRTEEPEMRPQPQRMSSSREYVERRPSPPRMSSSKDGVEFVRKGSDKHPSMMRRTSARPNTSGRSAERRRESEVVEEQPARDRRPPTLNHTKSSPPVVQPEVRQPEKQHRSYSVQMDAPRNEEPPIPKVRRAETMPYKKEAAQEKGSSRLRNGYSAYPTPETSPERPSRGGKFDYNRGHAYADDVEYASPDGYEVPASSSRYDTEVRQPTRATSHSKRDRDRYAEEPATNSRRTSSAAKPPPMPSRSTSYVYPDNGSTPYVRDRERPPPSSRENSSRLYGEVRTTSNSPANARNPRYSPPVQEGTGYSRTLNMDQGVNMQTGYKTSKERPAMYRRDTGRQAVR